MPDQALLEALIAYGRTQGWELVGACGGEGPFGSDPALDDFCAFPPEIEDDRATISVGRVQSDFTFLLTLEQNAAGAWTVIDSRQNPGP